MSFSRLNTHGETSIYAPIKVLETERLQTKHWEQRKTYLTCVECVSGPGRNYYFKTPENNKQLCESTIEMLKLNRRNKMELDVKCPALSRCCGTRACEAALMR